MTKIYKPDQIKSIIPKINFFREIEKGFVEYSEGNAVVPPVGELIFDRPPGEVHIKYGYIKNDKYYVIKIASGFFENPKINLPSSSGMMLLFNQKTGEPLAILLDEGMLTDIRTAVAGAICAKYLAPTDVNNIGIIGTGTQARLQLLYLENITPCKNVIVWGRDDNHTEKYKNEMEAKGFRVQAAMSIEELCNKSNLIITTTPVLSPLIKSEFIQPGMHITAVGSDTEEKQEIQASALSKADILVADSISQCLVRGEIHHAINNGTINQQKIVELGNVIKDRNLQRASEDQITIADLTGVAVQDIKVTQLVYEALNA